MIKWIILFFPFLAFSQSVEVFTDVSHPIYDPNHTAKICVIENPQWILNAVNERIARLNFVEKDAIASMCQADFKRLEKAYRCLYRAHALGVKALPTIIIDDKSIIGATDVPKIISQYGERA